MHLQFGTCKFTPRLLSTLIPPVILSFTLFPLYITHPADFTSSLETLTSLPYCHPIRFYQNLPVFPTFQAPISIWNAARASLFRSSNFRFSVERTRQIPCFSIIASITDLTYLKINNNFHFYQIYNFIYLMRCDSHTLFKDRAITHLGYDNVIGRNYGKICITVLLQSVQFNKLNPSAQEELLSRSIFEDMEYYTFFRIRVLLIIQGTTSTSAYLAWQPLPLIGSAIGLLTPTSPKLPQDIETLRKQFIPSQVPFKYHASLPHHQHLLEILNISFFPGYDDPRIVEMPLDTPQLNYDLNNHILPVEAASFRFLTCYSETELSFEFYVKPFQWQVWVSILLSILIIAGFLKVHDSLRTSFSAFFNVIGVLLEEAYSAPSTLWKSEPFRIVLISWLLMCIVLTNAYMGVAITDLSSPLKSKSLSTFSDLKTTTCQSICRCGAELGYNETTYLGFSGALYKRHFKVGTHFEWLSKFEAALYPRLSHPENFQFGGVLRSIVARLLNIAQKVRENCSHKPKYILEQLHLLSMFFPQKGYLPDLKNGKIPIISGIERSLISCGKIVFILNSNEIEAEYKFLQGSYKNLTFFKSEEAINSKLMLVITFDLSDTAKKMSRLLEAGIYSKIKTSLDFVTGKFGFGECGNWVGESETNLYEGKGGAKMGVEND
ncbi:hypothetical protein Fcan01_15874 [Folsomia candida]|uniref:Uncharacterized protein n=1 Tax=Folsomia candida TaxID=158441 RepID=A0A226DYR1_FOLCA|nr:hypothetical protein Fcan01_15874 [Folsomia candida]